MTLNVNAVLKDMVAAGSDSFGGSWTDISDLAQIEFKSILQRIKEIGAAVLDPNNTITLAKAKFLIKMQIDLAAQAIVALTTMTIVAVQKAIRSVLNVVRDAVNTGIGLAIL